MPASVKLAEAYVELVARDGGLDKALSQGGAKGASMGGGSGMLGALGKAAGAFGILITLANKFAAAANPMAGERLSLAFTDLQAAIGQHLQPVLEKTTQAVRALADAFMEGGFFNPGGAKMRNAARRLGLKGGELEETSGLFQPGKSSMGIGAFGQANFGDIAGSKNQFNMASLLATGGGNSIPEQQLTEMQKQSAYLESIAGGVTKIKPAVGK